MVQKRLPLLRGVTVKLVEGGSFVRDGAGLLMGEAYFSVYHLTAVQFPLHPFISTFLSFFGLAPMQVHPNVFRVLAAVLYLNETRGYGIGIREVMYFYRFARCPRSS
ncbi:hypothetical protein QJS10_CPA08g00751 [Acorus calamus]|uniref:Transposase (putative) gypsy type domain-containing protein n=1 Tax=Acorus calamus TaxID=4465 RepID=A0AAV9EB75_ACOCL|nr:hypothetical protein QJS10_CPA08g00751 [Acorus calamus]